MYYLKKEIKGLKTPEEIVIRDIADFIKLFDKLNLEDYIFRGESTNYQNIQSSGLRDYRKTFLKMVREYRKEIFYKLNYDDRKNFLAFAQHFGIPTNLIDFTYSPLVALYFACQPCEEGGEKSDNVDRGFVHLLRKDLINITDLIEKDYEANILVDFIENKTFDYFYKKFLTFNENHSPEFYKYFDQLDEDWEFYVNDREIKVSDSENSNIFNNELKSTLAQEKLELNHVFFDQKNWDLVERKFRNNDMTVFLYTSKLKKFLEKIYDNLIIVFRLNCIPNFIYTPLLSFERGRNQQGLFIYQSYLNTTDNVYNYDICSEQRIWPEKILVIENKERILNQLDIFGINQKFIYSDYDNIASYIKSKYKKE